MRPDTTVHRESDVFEPSRVRRIHESDDSDVPLDRTHSPRRRQQRSKTLSVTCAASIPNELNQGLGARHGIGRRLSECSSVSASNINTTVDIKPHENEQNSMRKLSGISKVLSIPNFRHSSSDDDSRPSSSPAPNSRPTPLLRGHTAPTLPKVSLSQKRKPPASHSSYGVETSEGPPPSYSTQQTLSQDRVVWPQERGRPTNVVPLTTNRNTSPVKATSGTVRAVLPSDQGIKKSGVFTVASPSNSVPASNLTRDLTDSTTTTVIPLRKAAKPEAHTLVKSSSNSTPPTSQTTDPSSPDTTDTSTIETPIPCELTPATSASTNMHDEYTAAAKGLEPPSHDLSNSSSSDNFQDPTKNADLFLKIAKDSAADTKENIPGSRRSRISLPFLTSSRPSTSMKSSPTSAHFDSERARNRTEMPSQLGKRSSLGSHVPGALTSTTYYTDARSQLGAPSDQASNIEPSDSRSQVNVRSRRHSNAINDSTRPPTRSHQARSRLASESLQGDRFRVQEQTQTESTISTTAPSTVWDELDDLKSRIKKLELTGKLPPSSAAAMSNERPRTATTQATTLSSSPKYKPTTNGNTLPSAIEGIPSTVHPTLHEALMNAKTTVSNDIYQKLQATAADALQLSTMLNHEYTPASASSPQSERQLRRRTESMCRSLTELTIALLAEQRNGATTSPTSPPGSRDPHQATPTTTSFRSRRLSDATNGTPDQRISVQSRVSSRLENRRTSLAQTLQEPSPRPVSRAMTEAPTAYRGSTRTNFSREYTRQHPLPSSTPAEPTKVTSRTPQQQQISNLISRHQAAANHTTPDTLSSSPVPFTISIQRPSARPYSDSPSSVVSEASPGLRSSGRRSLGFAARVSSVSSRLKAAREQRMAALNRDGAAASEVGPVGGTGGV